MIILLCRGTNQQEQHLYILLRETLVYEIIPINSKKNVLPSQQEKKVTFYLTILFFGVQQKLV